MIKHLLLIFILSIFSLATIAQNLIDWSADYDLSIDDFQANAPNTGQIQAASGSFSTTYEMGGINLITTRNLNKNVSTTFQKDASYFDKGSVESTERLLKYQQLIFDLYELQSRKLRQKFFIERKTILTKGPSVLHQQVLAEHKQLLSEIEGDTFNGQSSEEIEIWNRWVLEEIDKLHEFCKTCKPSKKKKNKK